MQSYSYLLSFASLLALVSGHAQILAAVGEAGSPTSVGFQVDTSLARNCTTISPCQQDATIIRDAEISSNVVNECGRTELSGNIDIGENTENAIAAGAVTQVKAGTRMTVTIHQVNADGAGPFACDLVSAGNNGIITANLSIENNVPGANGFSQAKAQDFNMTVIMPDTFPDCVGSSQGNVCTVRCRNNAQAGPFGGCFPVQQVDTTASVNTPSNIQTSLSADKIQAQVAQDQTDLGVAVKANQNAGTDEALANAASVSSLLGISVAQGSFPTLTPTVENNAVASATAATTTAANAAATNSSAAAATTASGKKSKGNKNNGNNANANNRRRSLKFARRSE
ncbi:gas1-like protein [Seiridium cupressi]